MQKNNNRNNVEECKSKGTTIGTLPKMYYLFSITDFQAYFENQTETANN